MGLRNAMRRVRKIVSKKTAIVAAVVVLGATGAAGTIVQPVQAAGDCKDNSVIRCGAFDVGTLQNRYASNSSVRAIYAAAPFGISSNTFYSSLSTMQNGAVYKNGTVTVGSRVVATNAITAGRRYIPGSSDMHIPGVLAYSRAPSVSFRQNSLSAFVKLDANGRFMFAVIKECGNPVTARPTSPPQPPKPVPNFTIEKKVRLAGTNNSWKEDITVKPGERVEYLIALKNTSTQNHTLTNMVVRDKLPNSMTYVKNSTHMVTSYSAKRDLPDGVTGRGINIGNVPAGGTAFVTFKADAPKSSNTNLKICETGEKSVLHNVAYAKPTQLPEKSDDADVETCRPGQPNFSIEKLVKIAGTNDKYTENVVADPGTLLEFVVAVKNTGNIPLKNMVVTDDLPTGMVYKAGTTRLVNSNGVNKHLPDSPSLFYKGITLSTMKVAEVDFVIFQAYLPQATSTNPTLKECETGKTKLVNLAHAKPSGLHTQSDTASAETCKKTPGFEVVKNVRKAGETTWNQDVTVNYGDTVEYQILVNNTGKTDLKNVLVTDTQPVGVTFVNGSVKLNGQTVNNGDKLFSTGVTIPEIKQGAHAEVTFSARVQGQPTECREKTFKNIASAKPVGLTVKSDDANVTAECVNNPAVSITKKVDGVKAKEVELNQEFTYQLVVKNEGNVALKNAVVTDPAPAGVQMISADKGTVTNNVFSYTIPNLAVGASETIAIRAKVIAYNPSRIVNTACVDIKETPKEDDACDTAETTTKQPAIKIVKKVDHNVVAVNGTFNYTIEVTNIGQKVLKNAKVTDPAPEGVEFLEADYPDDNQITLTSDEFTATIPTLNIGETVTYVIKAKVTKQVTGAITNTACVDAVEIPGEKDDCSSVEIHTPSYECTSLASISLGELRYRFTPQVAVDKASVKSVQYDFGDNSKPVVASDANGVEHVFVKPATEKVSYTVVATVTFTVNGSDTTSTDTCSAQIDLTPEPQQPCEYNPNLPKDSPDCVKDVCPTVPGMQTNPKDCEKPPVAVIPSTGAGDLVGGAAGISATTYSVAAFLNKRRALKAIRK